MVLKTDQKQPSRGKEAHQENFSQLKLLMKPYFMDILQREVRPNTIFCRIELKLTEEKKNLKPLALLQKLIFV